MEIIHIVLGKANPERMNGINKVVYQLATKQTEAGEKVKVWGITKDLSHNYGDRNFETVLYKAFKNPFKLDRKMIADLKSLKEDVVVHLHGGWVPIYASLAKKLKKYNVRFVLTAHGAYNVIAMQRSGLTKKIYFKIFEKRILDYAHRIHCIGVSEVDGLSTIYKNNKAFLQPYGFEYELKENKTNDRNNKFVVGFVGRIDVYTKGLDIILDAYEKFAINTPDSELWIVGGGDDDDKLATMRNKLHSASSIKLLGGKFGKEKDDIMAQMSCFVHASRNEGLPASVLEASAMAIPTVVSRATNVGSYIEEYNAGILLAENSAECLAEAFETMHKLYKNDSLKKTGENARKMIDEVFIWKNILSGFAKLYS